MGNTAAVRGVRSVEVVRLGQLNLNLKHFGGRDGGAEKQLISGQVHARTHVYRMELSSLLHDLNFSSSPSEKPLPSAPLPPITELLSQLQEKLIGLTDEPSERSSLIGQVEQLFQTAPPDWLLSPGSDDLDTGWAELKAAYNSLISTLIGCAALPVCEDDCSSLSAAANLNVPSRATAVSAALTALLGNWEGGDVTGLLLTVAPPICVFAVTHFQDQVWTSPSSRAAARCLQDVLLKAGGWRDSSYLLMGDREEQKRGILEGILDVLQPQLTKDSWQRCEAVKLVFAWTLLQVTRPILSPHLPRLLPPSLLLSDHYRPENCMLGVRCLHHILLNTPAADLRQFNRAEVLYQALIKHLYTNEAVVIQPVLSCLLDLLLVLEKPPSSLSPSSSRRKAGRHDNVLHLVLTHMEAEHKVALRRVYASALPAFIDRMGVAVCRHLRRVERVVLGYLEVGDPPEETSRLKILEVLQKTTKAAWPRMQRRVNVLLRRLLRLLVDVSANAQLDDSVRRQLMDQSAVCIQLLDACSHGRVQLLLQQVDSSCCSSEVLSCLATVKTGR
ncbi:TELO2-interacting protein 2 isoform X2 [Melanotaenia boesemani]|uniref:TELO2-interacting protein 2 isoform X2 n=1 Tax=Melanotaenia boesemani TaxID=1250792 RepID=UPI001C03EE99|nr:TELO2-interacting protein 2 isoform X2 [Melanotaenia boesemani]